jgi:hypothetical protein
MIKKKRKAIKSSRLREEKIEGRKEEIIGQNGLTN